MRNIGITCLVVGCTWNILGCAQEGVGQDVWAAGHDAGMELDTLSGARRAPGMAFTAAFTPDAGAVPEVQATPDATPQADLDQPKPGLDANPYAADAGADLGRTDAQPDLGNGPEAQSDATPSIPSTCSSTMVKEGTLCGLIGDRFWPGTSVRCTFGCRDDGTGLVVLFGDLTQGCYSYAMTRTGNGHYVVCLPSEYFCDIYCPAPSGG
jgi:hypothetical protein